VEYNEKRPHSSLGYRTPYAFAQQFAASPSQSSDSTATDRPQGPALRAAPPALTPAHRCAEGTKYEGEAILQNRGNFI
ncbi:MAG: transposase, partial [Acidobacteriaceae bacterium]|nr:transposase [Acidobacteriaceae bacterium]